jgi:hypothetical protein
MIASPWFSTESQEGSGKAPVYHYNISCKAGKSIEKSHRRYGTDNRPLCEQCARLNAAGR